jgi:hypothetical protein
MFNRITKLAVISLSFIPTAFIAHGQTQQPIPKAAEILELAGKALGGDAFFNPKPYRITLTTTGYDPDGEKTFNRIDTYKNGKYHNDQTCLVKKPGEPSLTYYVKAITDIAKKETWVWVSFEGSDYKKGHSWSPVIPFINKGAWKNMIFDSVTVIAQGGKEYYRLEVKFKNASDFRATYLIDIKTHLVYKTEIVDTKRSMKTISTYTNYTRVQNIMVPKKITDETTGKDIRQYFEHNISKFEFVNDIPDSLFIVPKK